MTVYAKISELPAASAVSADMLLEISQAGVSARTTPQQIAEFNAIDIAGLYFLPGDPVIRASQGSLYSRTDATGPRNRLWVNVDGDTAWTYFTASQ